MPRVRPSGGWHGNTDRSRHGRANGPRSVQTAAAADLSDTVGLALVQTNIERGETAQCGHSVLPTRPRFVPELPMPPLG